MKCTSPDYYYSEAFYSGIKTIMKGKCDIGRLIANIRFYWWECLVQVVVVMHGSNWLSVWRLLWDCQEFEVEKNMGATQLIARTNN